MTLRVEKNQKTYIRQVRFTQKQGEFLKDLSASQDLTIADVLRSIVDHYRKNLPEFLTEEEFYDFHDYMKHKEVSK